MGELIHRYHGTYRKHDGYVISTNDENQEWLKHHESNGKSDAYYDDLRAFLSLLSREEMEVVQAILDPNDPRMRLWMRVYATRRTAAYKSPTITITPELVADALHMGRSQVSRIFKSIRQKWRQIYES
jgi:hypothetical protein